MKKYAIVIGIILFVAILFFCIYVSYVPEGIALKNKVLHSAQVTEDTTSYEALKKVEDTCRAMIASYESDKLTYEQFSASESKEEQSWASQAKMRANKTAASYNNYILNNSYVWAGNVPADIKQELPYLE